VKPSAKTPLGHQALAFPLCENWAVWGLTLQQLEHCLLRSIGLSQHRSGGLLHDLRAGQLS
jgi:hypothetical protein